MSPFARGGMFVAVLMSLVANRTFAQVGCRGACRAAIVAESSEAVEPQGEERVPLPAPEVIVRNNRASFSARSGDAHPALRPVELDDFLLQIFVAENIVPRIECVQWRIDGKIDERTNPNYLNTLGLSATAGSVAGTDYQWTQATPGLYWFSVKRSFGRLVLAV